MYRNLLVYNESRICTIVINRESKLNALNRETLAEIGEAFREAIRDSDISGIIITGAGDKAFVAGADISELRFLNEVEGHKLASEVHTNVFNLIADSEKPVLAAINGYALGGGLELALACHIRIASENARFGMPEVSLGLIPGYGGTQRLPQIIGRGKALEMILSGEMVNAADALSFGLVNHVVPMGDSLIKANEIMGKILSRSANAISAAIRAINVSGTPDGYNIEIKEFGACFGSADFQEGTEAFINKRTPSF